MILFLSDTAPTLHCWLTAHAAIKAFYKLQLLTPIATTVHVCQGQKESRKRDSDRFKRKTNVNVDKKNFFCRCHVESTNRGSPFYKLSF